MWMIWFESGIPKGNAACKDARSTTFPSGTCGLTSGPATCREACVETEGFARGECEFNKNNIKVCNCYCKA